MNASTRVRREVFLPSHVDLIVGLRARQSARSKSQVHVDAVLLLNAIIAQTLPPESLAATVRAQYGVDRND